MDPLGYCTLRIRALKVRWESQIPQANLHEACEIPDYPCPLGGDGWIARWGQAKAEMI